MADLTVEGSYTATRTTTTDEDGNKHTTLVSRSRTRQRADGTTYVEVDTGSGWVKEGEQ